MRQLALGLVIGGLLGLALGYTLAESRVPAAVEPAGVADGVARDPDRAPAAGRADALRRRRFEDAQRDSHGAAPADESPGRAQGSDPPDRPATSEKKKKKKKKKDDRTVEQFLAALRAIQPGDPRGKANLLCQELWKAHKTAHVPLDLVQSLARMGQHFNAHPAVSQFTEAELRTVIRLGPSARKEDRSSWHLVQQAVAQYRSRGFPVDANVVTRLLDHDMAYVRMAGLLAVAPVRLETEARVRELAAGDTDRNVRARAVEEIVGWALQQPGGPSTEDLALVEATLREGHLNTRRRVARLVPQLGDAGARMGLALLTEEGLGGDQDIGQPLVLAAVLGGLGADLLALAPTPETYAMVAEAVSQVDEENRSVLAGLAPHLPAMVRSFDTERASEFYEVIASLGFHAFVGREARDESLSPARRRTAFNALWGAVANEAAPLDGFPAVARQMIADTTQSVAARSEALDALRDQESLRQEAFRIELAILGDPRTPPGLRVAALDAMTDSWDDAVLEQLLPRMKNAWADAAAGDASSLVRETAKEKIADWSE